MARIVHYQLPTSHWDPSGWDSAVVSWSPVLWRPNPTTPRLAPYNRLTDSLMPSEEHIPFTPINQFPSQILWEEGRGISRSKYSTVDFWKAHPIYVDDAHLFFYSLNLSESHREITLFRVGSLRFVVAGFLCGLFFFLKLYSW